MRIANKIETFCLELIQGKHSGLCANALLGFLFCLSLFFRLIVKGRNWAYDKGVLKKATPAGPYTISIGNLTAGGTGKTPLTFFLAKALINHGKVAILSRGYRSPAEQLSFPCILSNGNGPLFGPEHCGDEPYFLAKRLPKAFVIVGKERELAADLAAKSGVDYILLDDGMQRRQLPRDFEIVIMNCQNPFDNGHFLPRGRLREGPESLSRANLIVLNHVQDHLQYQKLVTQLKYFSDAPTIGTKMQITNIKLLDGNKIPSIFGEKVAVFCAIGSPDTFFQTIEEQDAEIVGQLIENDHSHVPLQKLKDFAAHSKLNGAKYILCTEKDAVKLPKDLSLELPVGVVRAELVIVEDSHHWEKILHSFSEI